ncbi:AAA family ATPase [Streptomyces cacaoi]|uniref:Uncharacterized protein n=1 Tax=Streptomyces cacaoi TaxID=1898 RepID=A0A4Y3QZC9_STRCI|nr:AAA family ATPase [Streptomyces cacaoi]NNG83837.1 AAA family ATPase [Streptomyces cacaoi]GEB50339.1 hypothetical protein SCA03_28900 [Streptomyces cacaoi]
MTFPSLVDLGTEQQAVVDLPFHGCHLVTGTPGSGKSVMAVYRAWALATAGRGVTLLTRSNLLHQYLAQLAPDLTEALDVTTYHRWIRAFWSARFRSDPPQIDEDDWTYDWLEMQQNCLARKVGTTGHLVIDEGQNLPIGFYQLCRLLGLDITVFADENQRIDSEQSALSEIRRALGIRSPIVLRENHRNSRAIAALASAFHVRGDSEVAVPTRAGPIPTLLRAPSREHLLSAVRQCFHAHPERSIGVICRSTHTLRSVQNGLTKLGLAGSTQAYAHNDRYRNAIDFSSRPIRLVSTASMKGLEFDSVFVPDLDAYTEDPTGVEACLRFFVLCTRAREDLHFAHLGAKEPPILSGIPESLLIRRTC